MKNFRAIAAPASVFALLTLILFGFLQSRAQKNGKPSSAPTGEFETVAVEAATPRPTPHNPWEESAVRRVEIKNPVAAKIVKAARAQEGDTYDPSYQSIAYPGGDVAKGQGVCTDVVIRALRGANIDLQKLVHEDMKRDFRRYGDHWNLGRTDKNIDHRRVPNLMTFFAKYGKSLPLSTDKSNLKNWQPGDIITWKMSPGINHIGIVSNAFGARGLPLVIHNAQRCIEQDYLDQWPITGHYRYPK